MVFKKLDFFSALDISRPHQLVVNQYITTSMSGREISRPYNLLVGEGNLFEGELEIFDEIAKFGAA